MKPCVHNIPHLVDLMSFPAKVFSNFLVAPKCKLQCFCLESKARMLIVMLGIEYYLA